MKKVNLFFTAMILFLLVACTEKSYAYVIDKSNYQDFIKVIVTTHNFELKIEVTARDEFMVDDLELDLSVNLKSDVFGKSTRNYHITFTNAKEEIIIESTLADYQSHTVNVLFGVVSSETYKNDALIESQKTLLDLFYQTKPFRDANNSKMVMELDSSVMEMSTTTILQKEPFYLASFMDDQAVIVETIDDTIIERTFDFIEGNNQNKVFYQYINDYSEMNPKVIDYLIQQNSFSLLGFTTNLEYSYQNNQFIIKGDIRNLLNEMIDDPDMIEMIESMFKETGIEFKITVSNTLKIEIMMDFDVIDININMTYDKGYSEKFDTSKYIEFTYLEQFAKLLELGKEYDSELIVSGIGSVFQIEVPVEGQYEITMPMNLNHSISGNHRFDEITEDLENNTFTYTYTFFGEDKFYMNVASFYEYYVFGYFKIEKVQ